MITKYKQHVLMTLRPTPNWERNRLILHWISLPFKMTKNLILGTLAILKDKTVKTRTVPPPVPLEQRQEYFKKVLNMLPIIQASGYKLYAPGVPFGRGPDGSNHKSENQIKRQAVLQFLSGQLNASDDMITMGTASLMYENYLSRGIKVNPHENTMMSNFQTPDVQSLAALNLSVVSHYLNTYLSAISESKVYRTRGDDVFREKYERLIVGIVESNDLSLLEGAMPSDPLAKELYNKRLKEVNNQPEYVMMKSHLGMMQPGLELTPTAALTLLASVRIAQVKLQKRDYALLYHKLIWKHGYGLLGLFSSKEDHSANLMNLYVLSKLAESPAGRFFWKTAMKFTWLMSKSQHNGFFTGLLEKAHPGTVSEEYLDNCIRYLCEDEPRIYAYGNTVNSSAKVQPVPFNEQNDFDFSPEADMLSEVHHDINDERVRAGLGFLAHLVMLEKDPKELLK